MFKSLESVIRNRTQTESKYKSLSSTVRSIYEVKTLETHYRDQIVIGGYRTSHFEMCPKAQKLYSNLPEDVDRNKLEKAAQYLDQLFAMEKSIMATEKATGEDIRQAEDYARDIMKLATEAGMEKEHSFVADHITAIKKWHKVEDMNPKTDVTPEEIKKKFTRPSLAQTPEPKDMDIDNQKFRISRNLRMQRKLKIIDND